jgi:hypothetical protein
VLRRVGNDVLHGGRVVGRWMLGAWYVLRDGEWDTARTEEVRILAAVDNEALARAHRRTERGRYWSDRMATIDRLGVVRSLLRTQT